jgi:hypothetical protein
VRDPNGFKLHGTQLEFDILPFFESITPKLDACPKELVELSRTRCTIDPVTGDAHVTVTIHRCTCDLPGSRRVALRFYDSSGKYAVDACMTPFMTCVRYRLEAVQHILPLDEDKFLKDEGGKTKVMEVRGLGLFSANGASSMEPHLMKLKAALYYEDCRMVSDQEILALKSSLLLYHDLKYRIEDASSNHGHKKFSLLIHPDADKGPEKLKMSDISPLMTPCVYIGTKRNVKKGEKPHCDPLIVEGHSLTCLGDRLRPVSVSGSFFASASASAFASIAASVSDNEGCVDDDVDDSDAPPPPYKRLRVDTNLTSASHGAMHNSNSSAPAFHSDMAHDADAQSMHVKCVTPLAADCDRNVTGFGGFGDAQQGPNNFFVTPPLDQRSLLAENDAIMLTGGNNGSVQEMSSQEFFDTICDDLSD